MKSPINWKKTIGWIAGSLLILLVVVAVVGYAILQSQSFHRYVLAKIVQVASYSTGGKVYVRNFDFHWPGLRADLYDIVIRGTEEADQKPLLRVDKLTVGLKVLSVLRHEVNLNELLIEHPVANLIVDQGGKNNLPSPNAPKQQGSQTNIFDLAVGHVLLSNGELYYNDRKTAISADAYALKTETHFSALEKRYSGKVSYHQGSVQYANLKALAHALDLQFSATAQQLAISLLVLTVGSSRVSLQANVSDYSNPRVDGDYDVLLHTQDVAGLLTGVSPAGDVTLIGKIQYQNLADKSLLHALALNGNVTSQGLTINSPQGNVYVSKIQGRYRLADGNLNAPDLIVDLLHGRVSAKLEVARLDTNPTSKIHAALQSISIDAVKQALHRASVKQVPLTGTVQGNVNAVWTGSLKTLHVLSDLNLHGGIRNASEPSSATSSSRRTLALNGAIHANYDGPRNLITVQRSSFSTPATSVVAEGQISDHSNLSVAAKSNDLGELNSLVASFSSPQPKDTPRAKPLAISGSAALNGVITGSWQQPHLDAQISASNLQVGDSRWSSLHATAQAGPSGIAIRNGALVSARKGQVSFSGDAGLRNWSYAASNPLSANISVHKISIAEIQQIANLRYPVSGDLSAEIAFRGTQIDPVGHGSVEVSDANAYGEPVQSLALQFEAANGSVNSNFKINLPAGSAAGILIFIPKTRAYKVRLDAPAIVLAKLHAVQTKQPELSGTLSASASGAGTLDDPQLTASMQLPKLQLRQTAITGIKAQLDVANHHGTFALNSDVAEASVQARGTVELRGDYYTQAKIDTTRIPLDPLLVLYMPSRPNGFQGETELHATVKGPLKDRKRMEAHLEIPTLNASYQTAHVEVAAPIRLDYANSVLVLQPGEITGTDTSLHFQGKFPLGVPGPMSLIAKGSVNLRLLSMFNPDLRSAGVLALDVHSEGSESKPQIRGQVQVQDVSFMAAGAPLGVDHLNGTLDLLDNQVQITQLQGKVGGGDISAGGTISYLPQVQFNIALQAKSVRLRYPDGVRAVLESKLTWNGTTQDSSVEGRVLIDTLSFTSDFDLATFMDQFTGASAPPSGEGFTDHIKLNVALQTSEELSAATSQISLEGQANLRVIGYASNPVIIGRADVTSGDIFFMKRRYQLERGIFNFTNPNQTQPVVNLLITTTVQQYNLSLTVVGPIDKLRTSYVSDPPLPPVDIINLIARGQTTEQSTPTNFGANSILAQGVASQLSNSVQKLAGISSLEIDPLLGGNNRNPSARVAVQHRITRNFLFTFSTDVTQPQSEIIQGEYRINKRWSVSAVRDENGGVAVDGRFHTTF